MIIVQNIDLRSWNILADQIRPFIDIHLGKQFILALNLLKVTRVEAVVEISVDFRKIVKKFDEISSVDFKIELPNYGDQR